MTSRSKETSKNNKKQFYIACSNGNLQLAQHLFYVEPQLAIDSSDMDAFYNLAFHTVCRDGHLYIAQWLLSVKPNINISANDEDAFCFACYNVYLKIALWLLSVKSDINISAGDDFADDDVAVVIIAVFVCRSSCSCF